MNLIDKKNELIQDFPVLSENNFSQKNYSNEISKNIQNIDKLQTLFVYKCFTLHVQANVFMNTPSPF
jgi:hypothetical protein